MKVVGKYKAEDQLGYYRQVTATREEVLATFDRALANKRVGKDDGHFQIAEWSAEDWAEVRKALETTQITIAGVFFEYVPSKVGIPPTGTKVGCCCPITLVSNGYNEPSGQPWDFVRTWDAEWGAFDFEDGAKDERTVIYIID